MRYIYDWSGGVGTPDHRLANQCFNISFSYDQLMNISFSYDQLMIRITFSSVYHRDKTTNRTLCQDLSSKFDILVSIGVYGDSPFAK